MKVEYVSNQKYIVTIGVFSQSTNLKLVNLFESVENSTG
jgi:hypothetical protein